MKEIGPEQPPSKEVLPLYITPVLMSGLPGKMAQAAAIGIGKSMDFTLLGLGLTSDQHHGTALEIVGKRIHLENSSDPNTVTPLSSFLRTPVFENMIAVDYSTSNAGLSQGKFFAQLNIPFVMGTSISPENLAELTEAVQKSEISTVIAPNMAPSLVILQAMFQYAHQVFPDALSGFTGNISESHQATKKAVSATAGTWGGLLNGLGILFEPVKSIRDPNEQKELGIGNLTAHGYHWIEMKNPDGSAEIDITTKIDGRQPYVDGTLMALRFLRQKMREGIKGQVFSMIDVLKAQGTTS